MPPGEDTLPQGADAEQVPGRPWWKRAALGLAWSGILAVASALLAALILLIVDLLSPEQRFTARNLSDWLFWVSALWMLAGLVAPPLGAPADLAGAPGDLADEEEERGEPVDRTRKAVQRRMRRMYDPWRWRFWGAALLVFGLSALASLLI
jgi:hypothetical protein